jgi:hypothetical protein
MSVTRTAEIFGSAIVAVGEFNPAMFSPDWLVRNNLIGDGDSNAAKAANLMVSSQATKFETDWFFFQVLANQFALTSKGPVTPAFKDLAVGVLSLVSHTPITALGLNFFAHFRMHTVDEYHKIGDALAPKSIWNSLYPQVSSAGMASLTIKFENSQRGSTPPSGNAKFITVQPSIKVKHGVCLILNDHRETVGASDGSSQAERADSIVDSDWQSSCDDASRVFNQLLSAALTSSS